MSMQTIVTINTSNHVVQGLECDMASLKIKAPNYFNFNIQYRAMLESHYHLIAIALISFVYVYNNAMQRG
jgi:hypothetical protein